MRLIDADQMAADEKEALEQTKWIPCSERQPQENGNYLAFYRTSDGTASLEFMKVDHCNAGGGWLHEDAIRMRKGVTNEVLLDVIFGIALLQMCQDNTVVINM